MQAPERFRFFLPSPPNAFAHEASAAPALGSADPRFVVGSASVQTLPRSYGSPISKLAHATKYTPSERPDGRVVPVRERGGKRSSFTIALIANATRCRR